MADILLLKRLQITLVVTFILFFIVRFLARQVAGATDKEVALSVRRSYACASPKLLIAVVPFA